MWPPAIWITSYKHTRLQTTKSISSYPPVMWSWKAKMPQYSSRTKTISDPNNYFRYFLDHYIMNPIAQTYGGRWIYDVDIPIVIPWTARMTSDHPEPSLVKDA